MLFGGVKVVVFCILIFVIRHGFSLPVNEFQGYRAAVIEFAPLANISGKIVISREQALAIMNHNLYRLENFTAEAKLQGAQIMVYPEYGFIGWPDDDWERDTVLPFLESIPDVSAGDTINPCLDHSKFQASPMTVRLSCIARKYQLVLVANLGEVLYCTNITQEPCRKDGRQQFNTAVAFSETGELLTKYRKHHLYFEDSWYDAPLVPRKASFNTSFGVTFGLFICFDIFWEFETPFSHYAYPTWWDNFDFLPVATALVVQEAWSTFHGINLLAANIGIDKLSSGSGIYAKGKPLAQFYNPTMQPKEKLLLANISL